MLPEMSSNRTVDDLAACQEVAQPVWVAQEAESSNSRRSAASTSGCFRTSRQADHGRHHRYGQVVAQRKGLPKAPISSHLSEDGDILIIGEVETRVPFVSKILAAFSFNKAVFSLLSYIAAISAKDD